MHEEIQDIANSIIDVSNGNTQHESSSDKQYDSHHCGDDTAVVPLTDKCVEIF